MMKNVKKLTCSGFERKFVQRRHSGLAVAGRRNSLIWAGRFLLGGCLVLYLACGRTQQNGIVTPTPPNGSLQPTLSAIQANTFSTTCGIAPCHVAGGLAPFRLDAANQSFASLVGVLSLHNANKNRVSPGDPDNSYILDIIQGNGVNGAVMPPGGNRMLSSDQINQINDWIAAGAQNN